MFKHCLEYLHGRDGSDDEIEQLISEILPIYTGEVSDLTGGAQLFYTPAAMPPHAKAPNWNYSILKEVLISGIDPYYEGRFYRYK